MAFRSGTFDLVITDRAMPELSGDQLASVTKQEEPGAPVILLSGFGGMMDSQKEKPAGIDLVLYKPITLPELRRGIATGW